MESIQTKRRGGRATNNDNVNGRDSADGSENTVSVVERKRGRPSTANKVEKAKSGKGRGRPKKDSTSPDNSSDIYVPNNPDVAQQEDNGRIRSVRQMNAAVAKMQKASENAELQKQKARAKLAKATKRAASQPTNEVVAKKKAKPSPPVVKGKGKRGRPKKPVVVEAENDDSGSNDGVGLLSL